jgi:hypothetical protein
MNTPGSRFDLENTNSMKIGSKRDVNTQIAISKLQTRMLYRTKTRHPNTMHSNPDNTLHIRTELNYRTMFQNGICWNLKATKKNPNRVTI